MRSAAYEPPLGRASTQRTNRSGEPLTTDSTNTMVTTNNHRHNQHHVYEEIES
jgi:hypothetical protein